MNNMEIRIMFDGEIPQLAELIEFKMHELDTYAEIVNGLKRELEKNITIRDISKNAIAGGYSIDFDINDDYFVSIWSNGLFRVNTVMVTLHEKFEFAGKPKSVIKGEITVMHNPDEPFTCDNECFHFNTEDELLNRLWSNIIAVVDAVINNMNEKRS